jgi:hypothetical protein
MLVWDDQTKRGDISFWKTQDIARSRIRQLLCVENNGHDLSGYELGTVRTVRDYEKYAGIHFKKRSFQKWTTDHKFPPNPQIEDEKEWEDSFMFSFYYLVNIERNQLPGNDYNSILVAFDDDKGISIDSESITGHRLKEFIESGKPIHYEKMFLTDKNPSRLVYWGHSLTRGWAERIEIKI